MSDTNLTADAGTDQMADALRQAAAELESIAAENADLVALFQGHGWDGMDSVTAAGEDIAVVRDQLGIVADLIGVGGAVVRGARLNNTMATHADGQSLGRT